MNFKSINSPEQAIKIISKINQDSVKWTIVKHRLKPNTSLGHWIDGDSFEEDCISADNLLQIVLLTKVFEKDFVWRLEKNMLLKEEVFSLSYVTFPSANSVKEKVIIKIPFEKIIGYDAKNSIKRLRGKILSPEYQRRLINLRPLDLV